MTTDVLREPVTVAGLYPTMPIEVYHADPVPGRSLSSTGARKLLPPSTPALFDYERKNPPEPTTTFDIGNAAHKLVLGSGPELVVLPFERWDTKEAKAAVATAREAGQIPLKADVYEQVQAMAVALRAHPLAAALLSDGRPEVSGFWVDERSGVWRRVRFDYLPDTDGGRRLVIPDYKTARCADAEQFAKAAADLGYHQQDAWYTDAAVALGLTEDVALVFVVQEKTAPYLVNVVQLDVEARRIGRYLNRQAIDLYAECESTGHWPGHGDGVSLASLPYYYERKFEDAR